MAGEGRKTTARRGRGATARTKKVAPEPIVTAPAPESAPAPEPVVSEPAPIAVEPAPVVVEPAPEQREWVPVVYTGDGVFSDSDAGVFVTGTRTRLRARVAARLLRFEGFRLAG